MKQLDFNQIKTACARLFTTARCMVRPEAAMLIECAADMAADPAERARLTEMLEEIFEKGLGGKPLCGQTGQTYVFIRPGRSDMLDSGETVTAVMAAAAECGAGQTQVQFITREPGERTRIAVCMLEAEVTQAKICAPDTEAAAAVKAALADGRSAPFFVGVGMGEAPEEARKLAALALTRHMDARNADPALAKLESRCLAAINALHAGGGRYTALAVNIEAAGDRGFCAAAVSGYKLRSADMEI